LKLGSDRGNAILEFVAFGLAAQLLIFGFLMRLGVDFRSQLAAQSMARQVLRTAQLTSSQESWQAMASEVASAFGISVAEYKVDINNQCASAGYLAVSVQVRSNRFETRGFCLNR
jgi:hypothetical protein